MESLTMIYKYSTLALSLDAVPNIQYVLARLEIR